MARERASETLVLNLSLIRATPFEHAVKRATTTGVSTRTTTVAHQSMKLAVSGGAEKNST